MKIAVPVVNGQLSMHFGHTDGFALVHVDPQTKEITGSEVLEAPPHEPGLLPRWLNERGVNVVIAGGMGRRAQDLFSQSGIEVLVGAPGGEPEDLVRAYIAGELKTGGNICDH